MKRKNNKKLILLLVIVIGISVGYAALASTIKINGTSQVKGSNWNIHWENAVVSNDSSVKTLPTIKGTNNTETEFTVTLNEPGDFYEFTVDAKNDGTIDGMIGRISSKINNIDIIEHPENNPLPKTVSYTVKYADSEDEIALNDPLLKGQKRTYKVRVEYRNDEDINPEDLNNTNDLTYTFSFEVDYVQKAASNNEEPTSGPVTLNNPTNGTTDGDTQYFANSWVSDNAVYYNPTTTTQCTIEEYTANTDKLGTAGCLKWYAYSTESGNVNLILDHNISTTDVYWAAGEDTQNPTIEGITYTYNYPPREDYNVFGPVTAMKKLRQLTSNWNTTGVGTYTANIQADYYNGTENITFPASYTIDHTAFKARFIQGEEIAAIMGNTTWASLDGDYYSKIPDYFGDNLEVDKYYWTETSVGDSAMYMSWTVCNNGSGTNMYDNYVSLEGGIRPVITVPVIIEN